MSLGVSKNQIQLYCKIYAGKMLQMTGAALRQKSV